MDSVLRPRDIQSRLRHGESLESVAEAARVSVDQLLPYAGPVLAERAHQADRAQRSLVRRRQPEPAVAGRTLGDAVAATLHLTGAHPDAVEWDAWRRDDGRWTLAADFGSPARSGAARFTYDAPGNYVTVDNDDAAWLVGDLVEAPEPVAEPRRRLAAVAAVAAVAEPDADQLSLDDELGSDALDLVRDQPGGSTAYAPIVPEDRRDEQPQRDAMTANHPAGRAVGRPATPARRRGRASVPSWDEIMFGQPD